MSEYDVGLHVRICDARDAVIEAAKVCVRDNYPPEARHDLGRWELLVRAVEALLEAERGE